MNNISKSEKIKLEQLKIIQLDILDAIHMFCQSNNIRYSIACGTLLGAIRHKGYIPWDDDVDIYLLRKDYNQLMTNFPDTYQKVYKIASFERKDKWDKAYAKAYNSKTNIIENAHYKHIIGVSIDIYPIDDVPDNEDEWNRYNLKRRFFQRCYQAKLMRFSSNRTLGKNMLLFLVKAILSPFSLRKIALFLNNFAQKFNGKGYNNVFESVQGMLQKHYFPKTLFEDIIEVNFEDRVYHCFANYHEYLKNAYGEYMKLPPKEKRISKHDFDAYWIN